MAWPRDGVARPQAGGAEMRGMWVTRSWMTSPAHVAQVVDDAERHGLTAVFVQVRGRGDAFYLGGPDPRASLLARQPASFDPLGELVGRARTRGLQVHAWLNVNLVAGATAMPTATQHVAVQHPEWLMVPRPLADTLLPMSPRDPRYAATLATWSRKQSATIEGVFASPLPEGAQDRLEATVDHLTTRYALDGLHLDYIRFPSPEFDVSRAALAAFRASLALELTPAELATLDGRAASRPLAFIDTYAARWVSWRRERLTQLVTRLGTTARRNRPALKVTAAVWPDPEYARDYKLQDWARWLRDGLIDAACPMLYMSSGATYERQLQVLADGAAGTVWPGIGAYKIDPLETARRVAVARARGFGGVLLYSYDSMSAGVGRPSTYLAAVQRRAFPEGDSSQAGAAR
ncbi:glycoside hydrolase family 10 protein [Luteitalea sp. TBR-22]|uniref:glycoside hydrolase family 10 protein n=1 Tax=Luteitalea sp. TBR-22 TaxID=2802971 RepID=UPI001EF67A0F|nr:family 10 glycosylhydrolase [Luteitalea sp. TBR-22]